MLVTVCAGWFKDHFMQGTQSRRQTGVEKGFSRRKEGQKAGRQSDKRFKLKGEAKPYGRREHSVHMNPGLDNPVRDF